MTTPAQTLAAKLVRWKDCMLIVAGVEKHRVDEETANDIRENIEAALATFERDTIRMAMDEAAEIARKHAIKCAKAVDGKGTVTLAYGKACGARDVEGLIREAM